MLPEEANLSLEGETCAAGASLKTGGFMKQEGWKKKLFKKKTSGISQVFMLLG